LVLEFATKVQDRGEAVWLILSL